MDDLELLKKKFKSLHAKMAQLEAMEGDEEKEDETPKEETSEVSETPAMDAQADEDVVTPSEDEGDDELKEFLSPKRDRKRGVMSVSLGVSGKGAKAKGKK